MPKNETLLAIGAAVVGLIVLMRWNNKGQEVKLAGAGLLPAIGGLAAAGSSTIIAPFAAPATPAQVATAPATVQPAFGAAAAPGPQPAASTWVNPWVGDLHWSQKPGAARPTESSTSAWGGIFDAPAAAPYERPAGGAAFG